MKLHEKLFLEALKASLNNQNVSWDFEVVEEVWKEIFQLAELQKVLPLIFHAVSSCPAARKTEGQFFDAIKKRSIALMVRQAQKTSDFLKIYEKLNRQKGKVLVVKGIICRELYPNPDLRISADEDLLAEPESFTECIEILQACGMKPGKAFEKPEAEDEIGFYAEKGHVYIELHRNLFAAASEAYGDFNRYFSEAFETRITLSIQGHEVFAMKPELHLFYMICHALKHFLHSGFGLRQVCDMIMLANTYGEKIDWLKLLEWCREIRAERFAASIFQIGKKYLIFDESKAGYPQEWKNIEIDETNMLCELLESGIYGNATMSRKHSSRMTLKAAASGQGKNRRAVLSAMFPAAESLKKDYAYLKDHSYLLPVAWGQRFFKYYKSVGREENNSALESVRIGNKRIQLLEEYGILEKR